MCGDAAAALAAPQKLKPRPEAAPQALLERRACGSPAIGGALSKGHEGFGPDADGPDEGPASEELPGAV